ncbi:MAG: hypothetical protein WAU10_26145, partial [Caldilineaceae bacterium]
SAFIRVHPWLSLGQCTYPFQAQPAMEIGTQIYAEDTDYADSIRVYPRSSVAIFRLGGTTG